MDKYPAAGAHVDICAPFCYCESSILPEGRDHCGRYSTDLDYSGGRGLDPDGEPEGFASLEGGDAISGATITSVAYEKCVLDAFAAYDAVKEG